MTGPYTYHNSSLTSENELTRDAWGAPTKDSGTPTPISIVFYAPTPTPTQVPAPAQTPAPIPSPPGLYTDANLQRGTKLALQLFVKGQEYGQL